MKHPRITILRRIAIVITLCASVCASADAGTLSHFSYSPTPLPIGTTSASIAPTIVNGTTGAISYVLESGALPPGMTLNAADGTISGTPTATGTFKARIKATSGTNTATANVILIVVPAAAGLSVDRPVFIYETNGVCGQPWGAAGESWPQQLFWDYVDQNKNQYYEMINESAGCEAVGRVPLVGCVAWGYEYTACTGGDTANGISDMSTTGGWQQYGEWTTAHSSYFAQDWYGTTYTGYITPLMPLDAADWPDGPANPTYAEWLAAKLSALCLNFNYRGVFCADYVVGLEWGDACDYHPRVLADFESWAGVTLSGTTVAEKADDIQVNYKSQWWDYKCTRFSRFYTDIANTLLAHGITPMVGGQIGGYPSLMRGSGLDMRLYMHGENALEGKYWFFIVELQSDALRSVSSLWLPAFNMGATACRDPDMRFGSQMDAAGGQGAFDTALVNAGKDTAWGAKYLKNEWLSVGWTHVAGRDGVVRRCTQSFVRSYWDAGSIDMDMYDTMLGHIPRHPFGPAFYYSVAIERAFETGNGKAGNSWWDPTILLTRELTPTQEYYPYGAARGLCLGYWASDVGVDNLDPADYPCAWIVYDEDKLPDSERAKLIAMAPIINIAPDGNTPDIADATTLLNASPVHIAQAGDACLNGLAFVDQNDSVIVMVSNSLDTDSTGTLVFNNVGNGTFACNGLLGTTSATLSVSGNTGSIAISVAARDTVVYEISNLKWIGHDLTAWADVNADKSANGWYDSSWYGWFYNGEGFRRWIYSPRQGWQYVWPTSTKDSTYFWDDAMQAWLWTGKTAYPAFYSFKTGWLYYMDGTAPNRRFWDYSTGKYVYE
jgi:hypothetical protein